VHEVTLKEDFSMAKYEVPQNLYEAVMGENPSKWKGKRNSVEMMTYDEALQFCEKLTKLLRGQKLIAEDETIRLPTEAEWEYCCRAGTTSEYSFGDDATKDGDVGNKATLLDAYGWHTGNAAGNDPPVGALKPNPWGLYDIHGYLWEFTTDDWKPSYADDQEPDAKKIALRSGSWKNKHPDLRSAARIGFLKDSRDDAVGFRCVKSKTNSK
jgi:formylglycine-generating enzyme required for sulfatase activity